MSEENLDLSQFDEIPDRVARAKAKAEAIKKARAAAGGADAGAPLASGRGLARSFLGRSCRHSQGTDEQRRRLSRARGNSADFACSPCNPAWTGSYCACEKWRDYNQKRVLHLVDFGLGII